MNLTAQNIGMVILVLIVMVPQLIKSVQWVIKVVKEHKKAQQEAFEAGQEDQARTEQVEERFEAGEEKIEKLIAEESAILTSLESIRKCLEWLNESDNLNIKYVIKRSWQQTVVEGKPLDHYEHELLEHRYAIYRLRGGNSWAEGMMNEIRDARKRYYKNQKH